MYSKSSTFLALTSILAILAVLSIAINDMQDGAVRRPFATSGKDNSTEVIPLPNGWDSLTGQDGSKTTESAEVVSKSADDLLIENELKFTPEDQKYFQENFKNLDSSVIKLDFEDKSVPAKTAPVDGKVVSDLNKVVENPSTPSGAVQPVTEGDLLVKNINNESLRMAGYTNFVIKPRPFGGKLFGKFDISMLGSLNIIEKNVLENRDGNEAVVLQAYEFEVIDRDTTGEIYDFLKAKIKDDLEVKVNETNQFGLSSFYINSSEPSDYAFLVVKTRDNVYALSYPKANLNGKNYFQLLSNLLKELI